MGLEQAKKTYVETTSRHVSSFLQHASSSNIQGVSARELLRPDCWPDKFVCNLMYWVSDCPPCTRCKLFFFRMYECSRLSSFYCAWFFRAKKLTKRYCNWVWIATYLRRMSLFPPPYDVCHHRPGQLVSDTQRPWVRSPVRLPEFFPLLRPNVSAFFRRVHKNRLINVS